MAFIPGVPRKAVAFPGHMVATIRLAAGWAGLAALVSVHTRSAFWGGGDTSGMDWRRDRGVARRHSLF